MSKRGHHMYNSLLRFLFACIHLYTTSAAHVCSYNASFHDTWLLCNIFKATDICDEIPWFDASQANYCDWRANVASDVFDCVDDVNITVLNLAGYAWQQQNEADAMDTSYSFPHLMTEIALAGHALRGVFEFASIAELTDLQTLNLAHNPQLRGDIDWSVVAHLSGSQLTQVLLYNTSLTGSADFSGIGDTLRVSLNEGVLCDPGVYECPTGATAAPRSTHTCVGKEECESTCKCSDGADGDDDEAFYTQLPFILSVSIGGGIVCCVLCVVGVIYMLTKRALKLNSNTDTKQMVTIQQLQTPSADHVKPRNKRGKRARTFSSIVSDTLGLGRTNPEDERGVLPPVPEKTEFEFPAPIDTANGASAAAVAVSADSNGAITPVQTPITPQDEIPDLDIANTASAAGARQMEVRDDSIDGDDYDDDDILTASPVPREQQQQQPEDEEEKKAPMMKTRYTITVEDFDQIQKYDTSKSSKRYTIRVDDVGPAIAQQPSVDSNEHQIVEPEASRTEEEQKHDEEESVADIVAPAETILTMSAAHSNTVAANDQETAERHPVLPEMTATAFNYDDHEDDITAVDPALPDDDDPALPDDDDDDDVVMVELRHAVSITDAEYLPNTQDTFSITEMNDAETTTAAVQQADS